MVLKLAAQTRPLVPSTTTRFIQPSTQKSASKNAAVEETHQESVTEQDRDQTDKTSWEMSDVMYVYSR